MDRPRIEDELAKGLYKWMGTKKPDDIDDVLEYLIDHDLLTEDGKMLRHAFWERFINKKSYKGRLNGGK